MHSNVHCTDSQWNVSTAPRAKTRPTGLGILGPTEAVQNGPDGGGGKPPTRQEPGRALGRPPLPGAQPGQAFRPVDLALRRLLLQDQLGQIPWDATRNQFLNDPQPTLAATDPISSEQDGKALVVQVSQSHQILQEWLQGLARHPPCQELATQLLARVVPLRKDPQSLIAQVGQA